MQWDLFCRVVDNFGDIGVCWRLAADLAGRGEQVRLWVDDASALAWMAPGGAAGVVVRPWSAAETAGHATPGRDVVIEAFGCELPAAVIAGMARAPRTPVWINLEYLSAEAFVERAHRLPSPQTQGLGAGLTKWFFYPGFTAHTGGLIREPDLLERQQRFDAPGWLAAHGATPKDGERVVSLFCYEAPALSALLARLARRPSLLLATAGLAARQVREQWGPGLTCGQARALILPALTQRDYDHLLWASDLNFVRGEDSFARAQWAAKPFVWQAYPQHDGAHLSKLEAFLARFLAGADSDRTLSTELGGFWRAWNGAGRDLPPLPSAHAWAQRCRHWRDTLLVQADLTSQLLGFVAETR